MKEKFRESERQIYNKKVSLANVFETQADDSSPFDLSTPHPTQLPPSGGKTSRPAYSPAPESLTDDQPTNFSAVSELRLRDLRRLDYQFNPNEEKSVLIRRHAVLFAMDPMRAVVMTNRLILIVPSGADSLISILDKYMKEWNPSMQSSNNLQSLGAPSVSGAGGSKYSIPFEAHAYEALITTVKSMESQEFDNVSASLHEILRYCSHGSLLPIEVQEKMRNLKNDLSMMSSRVSSSKHALHELTEDDEEMALMNLTYLKHKPLLYTYPLAGEILSKHDEIEELLESYLLDFNALAANIEYARSQIQSAEELVSLRLDTSRNELLIANTALAVLACSIGFSAYLTGVFGMNLDNTVYLQFVKGGFAVLRMLKIDEDGAPAWETSKENVVPLKRGERVALFWIAWAFITEKAENFRMTDQIFQKAIRRMAEPKDLLNKRYQQFQRRLARHFLNKPESDLSTSDGTQGEQKPAAARQVLGKLSVAQSTGSVSRSSSQLTSANNNHQRAPVIGAVSKSTVSSKGAAPNFSIYSEPQSANPVSDLLVENSSWNTLGSEKERRKENEGRAVAWSDGPLVNSGGPTASRRVDAALERPPSISVYVDEEFAASLATVKASSSPQSGRNGENTGLSVRRPLDRADSSLQGRSGEVERISRNPLARHVSATLGGDPNHIKDVKLIDHKVSASQPSSSGFAIFSDTAASNSTGSTDKQSSRSKPSVVAKSAAEPAFAIFSDNAASSRSSSERVSVSSHKIQSPVASLPTVTHDDADSAALDALLANMVDLDGEDGTINTRLARRDIDCMFFSPASKRVDRSKKGSSDKKRTASSALGGSRATLLEEARVLPQAAHRPFGVMMSASDEDAQGGFPSAANDISMIRETSQEYSMFGNMNTPFACASELSDRQRRKKMRGSSDSTVSFSDLDVGDSAHKSSSSMYISASSGATSTSRDQSDSLCFDDRSDATMQIQEQLQRRQKSSSGSGGGLSGRKALLDVSYSGVDGDASIPSRRQRYRSFAALPPVSVVTTIKAAAPNISPTDDALT
eukprot:gene25879-32385_t